MYGGDSTGYIIRMRKLEKVIYKLKKKIKPDDKEEDLINRIVQEKDNKSEK